MYIRIGFEVHVQLNTQTKMFCSCSTAETDVPNQHICPVCLGYPGALPVPNEEAIRKALILAKALGGQIHSPMIFARKNYFYPDLPKGYQITQHEPPLMSDGSLEIASSGKVIRIRRIHVEEDAAKTAYASSTGRQEENAELLVDFNRSGIPLVEIVTYPDIETPEEGGEFLKTLQALVRYLGISEANMEKGQMRADANISVSPVDGQLGTKVEIKNMNTIRGVIAALRYEIDRQISELQAGRSIVQETRMWDEKLGKTITMRRKETSDDYRYFPEPDIPPIDITDLISSVPSPQVSSLREIWLEVDSWDIPKTKVPFIVYSPVIYQKIKDLIGIGLTPKDATWLVTDVLKDMDVSLSPEDAKWLMGLVKDGKLDKSIVPKFLKKVHETGEEIKTVYDKYFRADVGEDDIRQVVREVLRKNPDVVEKYKSGKKGVFGFLMGQVMKVFRGKVPAQEVKRILEEELGSA